MEVFVVQETHTTNTHKHINILIKNLNIQAHNSIKWTSGLFEHRRSSLSFSKKKLSMDRAAVTVL